MGRNPFANKPTQPIPADEEASSPFPTFSTSEPATPPPSEAGSVRSHIENIPAANFHAKKREDKRARTPILFVRHLDDLRPRLDQAAEKLEVPRDMLVRFLLETGLARHRTGEAPLVPVLHQRLTLYPADPPRGKKRKSQPQTAKGIGFRGIPEATRQALADLAEQELGVPSWQVIRRLLENGLTAWEQGRLPIPVHTVTTPENTLFPGS